MIAIGPGSNPLLQPYGGSCTSLSTKLNDDPKPQFWFLIKARHYSDGVGSYSGGNKTSTRPRLAVLSKACLVLETSMNRRCHQSAQIPGSCRPHSSCEELLRWSLTSCVANGVVYCEQHNVVRVKMPSGEPSSGALGLLILLFLQHASTVTTDQGTAVRFGTRSWTRKHDENFSG